MNPETRKTSIKDTNREDLHSKTFDFSGLSSTDIALERERLQLEFEKITLERERLTAEQERIDREKAYTKRDPSALSFGVVSVCVIAIVCLTLGAIIGFTSGLDIGQKANPKPRKVLVSRQFIEILSIGHNKSDAEACVVEKEREIPIWIPKKDKLSPYGSPIILR